MSQNPLTRFLKISSVVVLTLLIACNSIYSQDKAEKIDQLIQKYHEYGQFNGSVLVSQAGKIIFKKGYGLANREWDIANDPNTKFRLGSITKQFTSMLIMQLVAEGKIKLDEKMTTYLSDYRKDTGDRVTIHHLLTHTSGIPSYTAFPNYSIDISRNPYSVGDFVRKFCSDTLLFQPGSRYSYSNSGYFLLGAIIEKVTGKKYETVLKKRIFNPLGMNNSGYDHHKTIIPNRATGYGKTMDGYVNSRYLDMSVPFSAGALYSTVEDLYLWDQALYTENLLSDDYKALMFKPFINNYAYGWGVRIIPLTESEDSLQVISHSGGINGFSSLITRLVDDKNLIVLLSNTGGTNLRGMNLGIINILYNKPFRQPEKSIAEVLYKMILKKDITAAITQYHDLKDKNSDIYNFRESELNRLGYQLLGNAMIDEAIEIFKLNIEAYPASFNVYDSLGEAYMKDGQNELAIQNYEKSIKLDPKNSNAVEMIKKLKKKK